jgi:hypothetical protein
MSTSKRVLSGPFMIYFLSLKSEHERTILCASAPRYSDAHRSGCNVGHLKELMSAACFGFTRSQVHKHRRKWGCLCMLHNSCLISALDGTIVILLSLPFLRHLLILLILLLYSFCDSIAFCVTPALYLIRCDQLACNNGKEFLPSPCFEGMKFPPNATVRARKEKAKTAW